MFILERLDGRHSGYSSFDRRAWLQGPRSESKRNFAQMLEWCWNTWGPGMERDLVYRNQDGTVKYSWAWHIDQRHGSMYIYLRNDLLPVFLLKWQ
jgi:hypothetical protein